MPNCWGCRVIIILLILRALGALGHAGELESPTWIPALQELPPLPSPAVVATPASDYVMGSPHHHANEAPVRQVHFEAFALDTHEVTNAEFAAFIEATGHVTSAELAGGSWIYQFGGSDFEWVEGADWRHPLGPGSSIADGAQYPVVQVSWEDAAAYARWAGKRLPTEEEWEYVASAGGTIPADAFDEHLPDNANVWRGHWPESNDLSTIDPWFYVSPVGAFPPNALGVHDLLGNVWEWTADAYRATPGPALGEPSTHEGHTADAQTALTAGNAVEGYRVARGGSWFCSANYCGAYRPTFRGRSPETSSFNNVGFRCARDVSDPRDAAASR